MLLVLAVVAALCLRAFAWADLRARENDSRDQAILQLQSAAQVLKATGGSLEEAVTLHGGFASGNTWELFFDGQWKLTAAPDTYRLQVRLLEPEYACLGSAALTVFRADGSVLAALDAAWQEDVP